MHIKANLIIIACMALLVSCGKKEKVVTKAPPAPVKPAAPAASSADGADEEKPVYVYSGDRFKDPFLEVGQSTSYQPDAIFNPDQAKVKAIIHGAQLRSAVLQVSGSGSYFIKGGRIFDVMGKTLKGFRAKIFPEKVIISGDEDDVFELKIRETSEDEEEKT